MNVSEHSKSEVEQDLAEAMVRVLELEVSADEIDPDAALFGEGLGEHDRAAPQQQFAAS